MFCNNCGIKIPYVKAPNLTHCSVCGTEFTSDVRDILEFGQYGITNEVRPTQVEMAQDIEDLLKQTRGTLLAEGGTGIGKSFAYLIPSMLSKGKRVIIATAKKALQDQLVNKDLPLLVSKMGMSNLKFGIYKGKSNYACWKLKQEVPVKDRQRFENFVAKARTAKTPADIAQWDGPIPFWWSKVNIDNCVLGSRCPHVQFCKPQPKNYNIVVTNHHLAAIDLKALPGTLLGPYNTLIFDEAHQAPGAFRSAFTVEVTTKAVDLLKSSLQKDDYLRGVIDDSGNTTAARLLTQLETLITSYKYLHRKAQSSSGGNKIVDVSRITDVLKTFHEEADAYTKKLSLLLESTNRSYDSSIDNPSSDYSSDQLFAMVSRLTKMHKRSNALVSFAESLSKEIDETESEFLVVCDEKGIQLRPLDIGKLIAPSIKQTPYKILMSATLAMGNDFSFSKQQFGLSDDLKATEEVITEKMYASPFDMKKQAIMYLPKDLPEYAHSGKPDEYKAWIQGLTPEIKRLVEVTNGDAFVLFSSNADMNAVMEEIGYAYWNSVGLNLVVQEGEASSTLRRYMGTPRSVLFGQKTFWEGVDIPGDKLKIVIITRLPFPYFKDPLISALSEKAGNQSFAKVMLPRMFFDVKQGVGRLIRTQSDHGFVAILDKRVWTKSYGKRLVKALGFKQITDDFTLIKSWAKRFFKDC